MNNIEVGIQGEEIVFNYLIDSGYKVLNRNWRVRHYEIDIIAIKNKIVHIVEVRTLRYPYLYEPYESITIKKQRKIIKAASLYVAKYKISGEIVFDIASVVINGDAFKLEYINNAFAPNW